MVKNLAHTPLTAILFAAIWCFVAPFFPVSESYGEVLAAFQMPLLGYAYITAYGLWLSIILALLHSHARGKGVILTLIAAAILLLTQWLIPNTWQIWHFLFEENTGAMTFADFLLWMAQGVIAMIFLLVLALLLFKAPPKPPEPPRPPHLPPLPPPPPDKYLLKVRKFIITMIVLPVIYMVIFFLVWFFLLLRSEDARVFYAVGEGVDTFAKYLVDMLLNDSKQIPRALIMGLLTILPLIPLMLQLAHKRVMFIILSVMFLLGPTVRMLIPSPVMPDAVRFAHMIEMPVIAVVFGGFSAFMMHMCIYKKQPPQPVQMAAPPAKGKKAAAEGEEEAAPEAEADAKAKGKAKK